MKKKIRTLSYIAALSVLDGLVYNCDYWDTWIRNTLFKYQP